MNSNQNNIEELQQVLYSQNVLIFNTIHGLKFSMGWLNVLNSALVAHYYVIRNKRMGKVHLNVYRKSNHLPDINVFFFYQTILPFKKIN